MVAAEKQELGVAEEEEEQELGARKRKSRSSGGVCGPDAAAVDLSDGGAAAAHGTEKLQARGGEASSRAEVSPPATVRQGSPSPRPLQSPAEAMAFLVRPICSSCGGLRGL